MQRPNKVYRHTAICPEIRMREASEGEESRTIEGYAILFDSLSLPLWYSDDVPVYERISRDAITQDLLDSCDIKLTMFHDFTRLLGRSNKGSGTLSYEIDERGVRFSVSAPNTVDGDKAIELVKRGDIAGCSFMFAVDPEIPNAVTREDKEDSKIYTINQISEIYDFTLTDNPAYPETSVEARALTPLMVEAIDTRQSKDGDAEMMSRQLEEMKRASNLKNYI